MKMPSGGRPAMATTPSTRPQPSTGLVSVRPPMSAMLLRALDLRDVADGEEDRRLGQRVHGHVQQAGEVGERPAHAEGEGDDAHVLDRGIGEHALDVAPAVEHEAGEDQRDEPHRHHQRPGRERRRVGRQQHLEAQQRVERDVEQQARQHGRDRRRALGMGIGQPGVQRRQADLGAVAEQQEDEGDVEQRRIEVRGAARSARSTPWRRGPRRSPAAPPCRRGWCRTARARCRRCRG